MAPESIREVPSDGKPADQEQALQAHLRQALRDLQFGTVTIVVQNGRVVQIERHEKLRLISNDPDRKTPR
jgi:hypothetical protein